MKGKTKPIEAIMIKIKYFWIRILIVSLTFTSVVLTGEVNIVTPNEFMPHRIKSLRNKFILIWTSPEADPIKNLGVGRMTFWQKNCMHINCFVTANRSFFYDVSNFDMIIYHGPEISLHSDIELPISRLSHQIYVFASMESPAYYPICNTVYNTFFNFTWTFKLKSDIVYGYIIIKDRKGNVIGPKEDMHWENVEDMKPIDAALKAKLDGKSKAAAWFVSNCRARNNRRQVASDIKEELEKYGFTLDVYGRCGWMSCERDLLENKDHNNVACSHLIEGHYYFYLSFENSFSEDYVTEKLLRALKHYAVPVVYGGANYTRFMPDGIYLSAWKLDVEDLVKSMVNLINNKEQYYNYFRWHNHYSYHDPTEFPETDPYCNLCAAINSIKSWKQSTDYKSLDEWWNESYGCSI